MALLGAALLMGAAACGGDGAEDDGGAAAAAEKAAAAAESAAAAAQGAGTAASEAGAVAEGAAMAAEQAGTAAEGAAKAAEGAAMAVGEAITAAEGAAMAAGEAVTAAEGAATAAESAAMAAEETSAMAMAPKETIVFADLNWGSAQIQNAIARYIVEEGYGYPTDAIFGGTIPLFQGLLDGEIHVTMEIWLPNQQEAWDKALADRAVIPVGKSIRENWQSAFVIPTYVLEQNPDLTTVQDIREFKAIFPQEEGKVVLVGCPAGWECEAVNKQMVTAYGLDDVITFQTPGGQEALFASLKSALDKTEPWLGYLWGPTLNSGLGLSRLEEPAYSDECWATNKACNYGPADVTIAVHPTIVQRAPEVIEFLRRWDFPASAAEESEFYLESNSLTFPETAIRYLKTNEAEWTPWVTADVARKVKAALANE
jgi:glycine betaine/proline transport system substrate-binding protein